MDVKSYKWHRIEPETVRQNDVSVVKWDKESES